MKPGIPKGTRDFSAREIAKRKYVTETIQKSFEKFGFEPIETPSFENYDTLMGKYGEEGDRLIFKILNSGDFLANVDSTLLSQKDSKKTTPAISDKALRYDLTVPFARYVVQHYNELTFPFKRYQMQPVWRADKPQKGRFREFYQCDADVIGSQSLLQEIEFIQLYDDVFHTLGLHQISIKINNRKILTGIADVIGESEKLIDFTIALDKLDKIGKNGVEIEWRNKGISEAAILKLQPIFDFDEDVHQTIKKLETLLAKSEEGMKGIAEMRYIIDTLHTIKLQTSKLVPDITLARGLNYYTGTILEVVADEVFMGSIGGGGRYDNLTGIFGMKDMSGMGISFGLDRIVLVLDELNLYNNLVMPSPEIMFVNFGDEEVTYCLPILNELRQNGIKSEIYPDPSKLKKQFGYADKRGISFILMAGKNEIDSKVFTLKDMQTGTQETISRDLLVTSIKNRITNL